LIATTIKESIMEEKGTKEKRGNTVRPAECALPTGNGHLAVMPFHMTDVLEERAMAGNQTISYPSRRTMMSDALAKITPNDTLRLFQVGARYSETTLLKHKWVCRTFFR
jgi:hypothetical protein